MQYLTATAIKDIMVRVLLVLHAPNTRSTWKALQKFLRVFVTGITTGQMTNATYALQHARLDNTGLEHAQDSETSRARAVHQTLIQMQGPRQFLNAFVIPDFMAQAVRVPFVL